jgi:diguanylate cyclase (GGDEF)-like protein/PAS domain S-box-containing protein
VAGAELWRPRDGEGLWDWNLVTNRIHFSPRWLSFVGCDDDEAQHTPDVWIRRIHPEDRDLVVTKIKAARDAGPDFEFHHRLRQQDGTYRWMICYGKVVRDDAGQAVRLTGAHEDVTVAKVSDPQTGLPNDLLLLDRISNAIERGQRHPDSLYAVLLLNLVPPTGLTSRFTPDAESILLGAVARRLETCLRCRDERFNNDVVARLPGDTFAILLENLDDLADAPTIAERVLAALLPPIALSGSQIFLTASIGIALSATGYLSADEMVRDAETAAHRARSLGGSHCEVFDTVLLSTQHAGRTLERDLSGALERREFVVVYQPIVSLTSQRILGFEALVRWHHPIRGLISPVEFIPLAEHSGFIVALGTWVLREACTRLKVWQESSPDLWMSVNLSGIQLKYPALVHEIGEILSELAVNPGSVALELTEAVAMDDPATVKTRLMQLRAMGLRVSMDDFGTGYSSLACLRELPVDTLKIDRSFIRGMELDHEKTAIARTLTAMAQELRLTVIAEGVENESQLRLLRTLGCDSAQGFLFAKPLDIEAASILLTTGVVQASEPKLRTTARGRWLTAASVAAILGSIGLAVRFTGPRPIRPSTPATQGWPDPPSTDDRVQPSAAPAVTVPPTSTVAGPSQPAGTREKLVTEPGDSKRDKRPTAKAREPLAINVEHLHRLGKCRGRLLVSARGVTYEPTEETSDDAFSLTYRQFLASTAENILTIQATNKIYRFKILAETRNDAAAQLQNLLVMIAKFR